MSEPNTELLDTIFEKLCADQKIPREYRGPTPVTVMLREVEREDRLFALGAMRYVADLVKLYMAKDRKAWFRRSALGAFSTITDEQGRDWQIKTGWDDYERFKLGEPVTARIWPDELFRSKLLDGAYLGTHSEYVDGKTVFHQKWVVIKGRVALCLVECEYEPGSTTVLLEGEDLQADVIAARHGIEKPPLSSWTGAAFEKYARNEAQSFRKVRQWDIDDYGLSLTEKAGKSWGRFMRAKMDEDGFFRRILTPSPVPDAPVGDAPHTVRVEESSP